MIENAFTCTGAYAVLIASGFKHVENRSTMPVPASGLCAMSVSRKFCQREYDNLVAWLKANAVPEALRTLPSWAEVREWPGKVVATMDYEATDGIPSSGLHSRHCSIWNEGYRYWWLLSNVCRIPNPIPCRGNVGMWRLPENISKQIPEGDYQ